MQERLGKDGKVFKIIKFRTKIVNAEHMGDGFRVKEGTDPRITKIGRFLRKTSLDELPQLFNTLAGSMSLVGDSRIIETTKKNLDFMRFLAA